MPDEKRARHSHERSNPWRRLPKMRRVKRRQTHPRRRQKQTRESISLHIPHRYGGAAAAAWTDACARVNQKATTTISHQQTQRMQAAGCNAGAQRTCVKCYINTLREGGAQRTPTDCFSSSSRKLSLNFCSGWNGRRSSSVCARAISSSVNCSGLPPLSMK